MAQIEVHHCGSGRAPLSTGSTTSTGKTPLLKRVKKTQSMQATPQQEREARSHEPDINTATLQHKIDDCGKE
jgi:hypothetical protein